MIRHIAIIGGGFSGALQAINLLRHHGPRATLIEQRAQAGRGVAYSAAHPDHLLNVRAANMSALPDDPGHFVRWLERTNPQYASGFAHASSMAIISPPCLTKRGVNPAIGSRSCGARPAMP